MLTEQGHWWEQTDDVTMVLKCSWRLVLTECLIWMKKKRKKEVYCNFISYFLLTAFTGCISVILIIVCLKKVFKVWLARGLLVFWRSLDAYSDYCESLHISWALTRGAVDVPPDVRQRAFPWVPLKGFSGQTLTREKYWARPTQLFSAKIWLKLVRSSRKFSLDSPFSDENPIRHKDIPDISSLNGLNYLCKNRAIRLLNIYSKERHSPASRPFFGCS